MYHRYHMACMTVKHWDTKILLAVMITVNFIITSKQGSYVFLSDWFCMPGILLVICKKKGEKKMCMYL